VAKTRIFEGERSGKGGKRGEDSSMAKHFGGWNQFRAYQRSRRKRTPFPKKKGGSEGQKEEVYRLIYKKQRIPGKIGIIYFKKREERNSFY